MDLSGWYDTKISSATDKTRILQCDSWYSERARLAADRVRVIAQGGALLTWITLHGTACTAICRHLIPEQSEEASTALAENLSESQALQALPEHQQSRAKVRFAEAAMRPPSSTRPWWTASLFQRHEGLPRLLLARGLRPLSARFG